MKRAIHVTQIQRYVITAIFLGLSCGLIFFSMLTDSYKIFATLILAMLVSAVVLNIKKIVKAIKEGGSKMNDYRQRLFFNTTRLVIVGVVLTWLVAGIPLISPIVILLYIVVGVVLIAAIISSVWLLFTREVLVKKLAAVLYILVIPILVAGATYAIVLSNLSF